MPEESHGQSSSKQTRSSMFPENVKLPVCFFCEESANEGDLLTFISHAAKDWNSLPNDLKECNILSIFKSKLKTF